MENNHLESVSEYFERDEYIINKKVILKFAY